MMENAVRDVVPQGFFSGNTVIATLWIFLVVANLVGLIPGLHSPTADLSVTARPCDDRFLLGPLVCQFVPWG